MSEPQSICIYLCTFEDQETAGVRCYVGGVLRAAEPRISELPMMAENHMGRHDKQMKGGLPVVYVG